MASTIICSSCCYTFLSLPTTPSNKSPLMAISKEFLHVNKKWSAFSITNIKNSSLLRSSSSSASSTPTIEEDEQEPSLLNQDSDDSLSSVRGCKACGKEEIERGCNGEGRIQGGIATFPGFGWWPIKAYRPCPGFLVSGGRYRRTGQTLDDIGVGAGDLGSSTRRKNDVKSRFSEGSQKNIRVRGGKKIVFTMADVLGFGKFVLTQGRQLVKQEEIRIEDKLYQTSFSSIFLWLKLQDQFISRAGDACCCCCSFSFFGFNFLAVRKL